ncbi:MAG: hypothetical protein K1X94_03585 [Sandaracinaceae bacterium]|nr:hypothetical protein [Sandaracinaceae bacterium]
MDRLQLPSSLEGQGRVLLAGAGGGYDVYATLPLLAALEARGVEVVLTNLYLRGLEGTESIFDVGDVIEAFRERVPRRAARSIPH